MPEHCSLCGTLVETIGTDEGTMHYRPLKKPEAVRVLEARVRGLEDAIGVLQPLARRYADGRRTYVTGELNDLTRHLMRHGVSFPTPDGTPWARDGMGHRYCNLTPEEFALGEKVPT